MPVRYIIASAAAITLIIAGFTIAAFLGDSVVNDIRQQLRDVKATGSLPAEFEGVDIETVDINDIGMEATPGMMWKLTAAGLLMELWFIWVPLVLLICFGAAAFILQK